MVMRLLTRVWKRVGVAFRAWVVARLLMALWS